MADKIQHTQQAFRVYITGIVVSEHGDPTNWSWEALCEELGNGGGPDCQARLLGSAGEGWPAEQRPKRVYTCSLCGGRHSARWCVTNKVEVEEDE